MKPEIVSEWYKVEYSWYEYGSPSISYKGNMEINSRKGAEEFIALILYLSKNEYTAYSPRQLKMAEKLLGWGKGVRRLLHFYKYVKLEIPIKGEV